MTTPAVFLKEFVESLKGRGFEDVILLAERESIRAYRRALRPCRGERFGALDWCDYSRRLVDMIEFLRSESKPLKLDSENRRLMVSVKRELEKMKAHSTGNVCS
ncbi:MAG: hypothetical protein MUD16_11815 [Desulfobacterales bacterium]|jgi:hypothetical protein|nr:hypothetical protein [Desulfobacterales bacterium]